MRVSTKSMMLVLSMGAMCLPGAASAQSYLVPAAATIDLVGNGADRAGYKLATGDINGDGEADLLVSAPQGAGLVRAYFGPLDPNRSPFNDSEADAVFEGHGSIELGWALTTADVNNDGVDDVVITAPSELSGGKNGVVYVFEGPIDPNTYETADADRAIEAAAGASLYFGWSLASGDFNGDGQVDLAVGDCGNYSKTYLMFSTSAGRYRLGEEGNTFTEFEGDALAGCELAAGDFNADGFDELAIGAPGEPSLALGSYAGATFLVYGRSVFNQDYSLRQPTQSKLMDMDITAIFGENEGENSGHALDFGDLNHDGYEDLLIGAPYFRCPGCTGMINRAGSVYVVDGRPDNAAGRALPGQQAFGVISDIQQHFGETALDYFGYDVAFVGHTSTMSMMPKFAVGAPGSAKAYLYTGDGFEACFYEWDVETRMFERTCFKLEGTLASTYTHQNPFSFFGFSVQGNASLIDNGLRYLPSLVVAAPYQLGFNTEVTSEGHTYVFTP